MIIGQRGICFEWPDRLFRYYLCWQRNGKGQSQRSVDEYCYVSSQVAADLREQARKSYVTSYQANEELVTPRMFSRELRQ